MIQDGKVFLVDFGIARIFIPQQKGTAIGTPGYASPEQYKGFAEPRSDLYSLGAVMHYLLTGINPEESSQTLFTFDPIRRSNANVPEYLERIILSMVALVPDKRPLSAEEVERLLGASEYGTSDGEMSLHDKYRDIYEAVRMNDHPAVKRFIRLGVSINTLDEEGRTPLHIAVEGGCKETVQSLIAEGAAINARDNRGLSPLDYAEKMRLQEIARLLRKYGARESPPAMLQQAPVGSQIVPVKPPPPAVKPPPVKPSPVIGASGARPSLKGIPGALIITAILIVTLILGGDYYLRGRQKEFKSQLEQAESGYEKQDYVNAAESLKKALAIFPKDATAKTLLVKIYLAEAKKSYDEKNYGKSQEALTRLRSFDPGNAEAMHYEDLVQKKLKIEGFVKEGDRLFNARDFKASQSAYEEALRLEPDNPALKKKINQARNGGKFLALLKSAQKSLQEHNYEAARATAEKALEMAPGDEEARRILADARIATASEAFGKGKYRDAYRLTLKVLKDSPDNKTASDLCNKSKNALVSESLKKGIALLGSKRLDEAKGCFNTVLTVEPGNAEAKKCLETLRVRIAERDRKWSEGSSYFNSGDFDSAIACYKAALNIDAGNQKLRSAIADAASSRERLQKESQKTSSSCQVPNISGTWQEIGGVCSGNFWSISQNGKEVTSISASGSTGGQSYSWYGANMSWSGSNVLTLSYIYTQRPSGWLNGTMIITFQDSDSASVHCMAKDRSLYDVVYSLKRVSSAGR